MEDNLEKETKPEHLRNATLQVDDIESAPNVMCIEEPSNGKVTQNTKIVVIDSDAGKLGKSRSRVTDSVDINQTVQMLKSRDFD